MTTDADRWVAERLDALWDHPAWPGGAAFAGQVPALEPGKRYTGWLLRGVGIVVPERGPWPAGWVVVDGQVVGVVQLWAIRADVPGSAAWAELRWEPGLEEPYPVAFRDWMGLGPEGALAAFTAADQLLRGHLRAGRRRLEEYRYEEHPWRRVADDALARKERESWRTWPQIAAVLGVNEDKLEDWVRRRKRELARQ